MCQSFNNSDEYNDQTIKEFIESYIKNKLIDDVVYFTKTLNHERWNEIAIKPDLLISIIDLPNGAKVIYGGKNIEIKNNSVIIDKPIPLFLAPYQILKVFDENNHSIDFRVKGYLIMNLNKMSELIEKNKTEQYHCSMSDSKFNFFNGIAYLE